jgi:hypothetical protein
MGGGERPAAIRRSQEQINREADEALDKVRQSSPPTEPQQWKRRNLAYNGPGIIGNVYQGKVNARKTDRLLKAHWEL